MYRFIKNNYMQTILLLIEYSLKLFFLSTSILNTFIAEI